MGKDLDKQIYIYSLDTSAFYTDEEYEIFKKFMELSRRKGELKKSRNESKENKNTYKELIKDISSFCKCFRSKSDRELACKHCPLRVEDNDFGDTLCLLDHYNFD